MSVTAALGSEDVQFNCSSSILGVSLTFLVDGEDASISDLLPARGITFQTATVGERLDGFLTVEVSEENNNTEVHCELDTSGVTSISRPAVLSVGECKYLLILLITI